MKYKITIKTDMYRDTDLCRVAVECIYVSKCTSFEEAMRKAEHYATMQCTDEHCNSVLSVEVERYEEDA